MKNKLVGYVFLFVVGIAYMVIIGGCIKIWEHATSAAAFILEIDKQVKNYNMADDVRAEYERLKAEAEELKKINRDFLEWLADWMNGNKHVGPEGPGADTSQPDLAPLLAAARDCLPTADYEWLTDEVLK